MVICIVALIVLSIMSLFSAKYRAPAGEAFRCVFRMITLRPCDVQLETKIKTSVTSKLMVVPALARFFYKNFKIISWIFTIAFFVSLAYSAIGVYNIIVYGTCTPGSACVITSFLGLCILVIEKTIVYVLVAVLALTLVYFTIKRKRSKAMSIVFQTDENQLQNFKRFEQP
jgi:hypothetical protein